MDQSVINNQNATLTLWLPVGVGISAACLILLAFIILASFLCCFHSTWCIRCPCNRKRGRAQLTVTRLEQPTRRRDNTTVVHVPHGQQTSNGITMFVGPKTTTLLSHPSNMSLHPPTSASSTDSHSHLLSPFTALSLSDGTRLSIDSCAYVLPNNMTDPINDGSERSTSWQKCEKSLSTPVYILTRAEAETALRAQGTIGCYLFRKTSENDVCLSALAENDSSLIIRHLLLVHNAEGLIRINSLPEDAETFVSLRALEEYYWENQIHFQDGGCSLSLTVPCKYS